MTISELLEKNHLTIRHEVPIIEEYKVDFDSANLKDLQALKAYDYTNDFNDLDLDSNNGWIDSENEKYVIVNEDTVTNVYEDQSLVNVVEYLLKHYKSADQTKLFGNDVT